MLAETLLEASPDPIVIVDHNGRINTINTRIEETFGYSREELLGQTIELLIPERLRAGHIKYRNLYQENPETCKIGAVHSLLPRHKDGSEFAVNISLIPFADSKWYADHQYHPGGNQGEEGSRQNL